MHERYAEDITPAVEEDWMKKLVAGVSPKEKNDAGFRAGISRAVFANLPNEEKKCYEQSAKEAKEAAITAYKQAMKEGHSKTPEKQQQSVYQHPYIICYADALLDASIIWPTS